MALDRLETDIHVRVAAECFYRYFCDKTYDLPNTSPLIVKELYLVEGEWGKEGSIIFWNYVDAGKQQTAKELTEAMDRKNNSVTYKVIEGSLLECYRCFKFILQVTPDEEHGGSVVHWILEYEKLFAHVSNPYTLMYVVIQLSKNIECHLLKC